MNNTPEKIKSGSCFHGKASVVAPLVGAASLVCIVLFFVLTAHDSEGQLWGQLIGAIIGSPVLLISTFFGLRFGWISRREEKCRLLFSAGLVLNFILLLLILYILFSALFPFFVRTK